MSKKEDDERKKYIVKLVDDWKDLCRDIPHLTFTEYMLCVLSDQSRDIWTAIPEEPITVCY